MTDALITIITPTTGKKSLYRLIDSLNRQSVPYRHLVLWDDKREDDFLYPDGEWAVKNPWNMENENRQNIVLKGRFVKGKAYGSSLRAVGLMIADTPYVTFADDDVWYEDEHLKNLLETVDGKQWGYCRRKIWMKTNGELRYLGIDNFESVGDSPERKVPYEMVDNNVMVFSRRFGSSAAVLYRETEDYNDDRLMYGFLKKHAGEPGISKKANVNQLCPLKLIEMFEKNCS